MSYDLEALGRRIRSLRVDRGWNQSALALRVGFNVGTVSGHERGSRSLDVEQLAAYAEAFEVTPSELIKAGRKEEPPPTVPPAPQPAVQS